MHSTFKAGIIGTALLLLSGLTAQGVLVGTQGQNPHPSATFEVRSNTGGFLPPVMSTADRNAIPSPANGLLIFNSNTRCLEIFLQLQGWTPISCDCPNPPSAQFTTNTSSIGMGGSIQFNVSSPSAGVSYNWAFPGGTPSSASGSSTTASFSTPGTYTATLVATDALGCTDSSSTVITVTSCPPIGNNTVTFNATQTTAQNGNIQTWTVPAGICTIRVQAWGAQGGGTNGGLGAMESGEFSVTAGETLYILVGQRGGVTSQGSNYCGGGGGGTFVYRNANDAFPLIAAAGGGGQSRDGAGGPGQSGTNNSNGGGSGSGPQGTNGNGGGPGLATGLYSSGAGGAGWLSNGQDGVLIRNPPGTGGQAPRNGGMGGTFSHPSYTGAFGGFGGGGAASDNSGAGGGGGGFNGGGGGNNSISSNWGAGSGGSSYNGGANPSGQSGVRSGDGQVIITW